MVRPLCRDPMLLAQKAEPATEADIAVAQDLKDTLEAHAESCVGMAANMIGIPKAIIVFAMGPLNCLMLNPKILRKSGAYEAEEGCLSLTGVRKTTRYRKITVEWQDLSLRRHRNEYTGFTAQIIQHETDHLDGILI